MKIVKPFEKKTRLQIKFEKKGRTKQSMKDECDINNIVARYDKTGVLQHVNEYEAQYGDVTATDFLEAMLIVQKAKQMFSELPSKIRNKFNNDPAQFIAFTDDPANKAELIELGLANAEEPEQIVKVEVTNQATPSESASDAL